MYDLTELQRQHHLQDSCTIHQNIAHTKGKKESKTTSSTH